MWKSAASCANRLRTLSRSGICHRRWVQAVGRPAIRRLKLNVLASAGIAGVHILSAETSLLHKEWESGKQLQQKLLQQKLQADRVFPSACDRLRPSDLHDQREWDGDLRYNELAPDGIGPVYGPVRHDANAPFADVLDARVSKLFLFPVGTQHEKLPDPDLAGSWMPPVPPSFLILCFAHLHWTMPHRCSHVQSWMVLGFADIR